MVCLPRGCLGKHLPVNRITDRCKNITFPHLLLRTVIKLDTQIFFRFLYIIRNIYLLQLDYSVIDSAPLSKQHLYLHCPTRFNFRLLNDKNKPIQVYFTIDRSIYLHEIILSFTIFPYIRNGYLLLIKLNLQCIQPGKLKQRFVTTYLQIYLLHFKQH